MKTALGSLSVALLLLAGCPAPQPPPPPASPPRITAFSADRTQVMPGEAVKLSFTATDATGVSLVDQSGAIIPLTGDASAGQASINPTRSTLYVLRAEGAGGRDAQFVQVAVGEPLKEVFFVAVPPQIAAGEEAQLIFSAFHATQITVTGSDGSSVTPTGSSGVVHVSPSKTTRYELNAFAGDAGALKSGVEVKVRPVLLSFEVTPVAARSGEKLTLSWKTAGADELTIAEANFGQLLRVTDSTSVAMGQLEWVVPTALGLDGGSSADAGSTDGGAGLALPDGFPLAFTLTAKSNDPAVTLSRVAEAFVGDGPRIDAFIAPPASTIGKPMSLSWSTTNAVGLKIFVNGLLVFEPLATAAISAGSFRLTTPPQDTTFELVVTSFRGLTARSTRQVLSVKPPKLLTATLPAQLGAAGSSASATWTTQDASEVQIYLKQGPLAFVTNTPARVAAGMTALFPARTSTFVFSARNLAGDTDELERIIQVGAPAQVAVTPTPTTPGADVALTWDLSGVPGFTALYGVPIATATPITNSTRFIDLATSGGVKQLSFANSDDAVALISKVEGLRFPFLGRVFESFAVSTNGFVAFGGSSSLPDNVDLAQPNSAPPMVAPFWDDLELGTGNVSSLVGGTEFPRVLVVQWTNVRLRSDPLSNLTFQVQLSETGSIHFVYKTLTGSGGEAATIGVQLAKDEFYGQHAFNTAVLSEGLELEWLTSSQVSGTVPLKAGNTAFHSLTWLKGADHVQAVVPLYVFGPNSIAVREAMPLPDPAFSSGQWIELHNPQPIEIDLGGLTLSALGSTTGFFFPSGVMLPANGYLVVGDSTDAELTGDAGVSVTVSDVVLAAADSVSLAIGPSHITALTWTEAVVGSSNQSPEIAIDTGGIALSCARVLTFNGNGNVGTPGKPNESCFDYSMTAISGAFEDLSGEGIDVLASQDPGTGRGVVTLPAPFTYFGTTFNEINVSMEGFASFGTPLTSNYPTNATKPLTTVPNGVLAVFWDDLVRLPTGRLVMARRPDHTILSWQHFRFSSPADGDLSFQIKLFDNRSIEFHYGTMNPAPTALTRSTGLSATTWIEELNGEAALPVNINTAGGIQPNTAYRFVPQP